MGTSAYVLMCAASSSDACTERLACGLASPDTDEHIQCTS